MTIVRGDATTTQGRPRKAPEAKVAIAKAAVACGMRPIVVARYLGVSRWMVWYWTHHERFAEVQPNPAFAQALQQLFTE